MGDQTTESIIFELRLNSEQLKNEQKLTRESLQQLILDIDKTKEAQKALNKEKDAGKLTDEQYSRQALALREQLKGQQADYRDLSKALETSQKVMQAGAGSIVQLRARLSELTAEWNNLSAAERNNSEEGKRVQAEAKAVSDELKKQESLIGDNRRNVGNYAEGFKQGLAGIVAELVKARAAQQDFAADSDEAARNRNRIAGFQTAAQRAAAQAGITDFTQAKAVIDQYTQAFTPAVENLRNLQQEQRQAAQTVGEESEQYQQLGFRIAGAQQQLDDLVASQVAAEKSTKQQAAAVEVVAGSLADLRQRLASLVDSREALAPATEEAKALTEQINELKTSIAEAEGKGARPIIDPEPVKAAAGSLAALREELLQLQAQRETLNPTSEEAEKLNTKILNLRTTIQQAEGKIDEFGEKIQRNIKKENFDTVNDAIQGVVGTMSAATIIFGDNTDAAKAQAKALQLMALAQNARAIAIGLDSAKDAAAIVLMKVKGLLLKEEQVLTTAAAVSTEAHAAVADADAAATEAQASAAALNAEGQAASTEATAASTVATEAQTVATEGATAAQEALNVVLKLNPIGLVIIAVAALVSLFAVYRNASDTTQKKIRDITEAFLRFSNPIGLVYTGIEKLYQKFAGVRAVLDPLIGVFSKLAGEVKADAIAFAQYIGLMDTAAEAAAKLAAAELERAQALREQADAETKLLESTGATAREVTQQKLDNLAVALKAAQENDRAQQVLHEKDLKRIAALGAAHEILSEKDKKIVEETNKARLALTNLVAEQSALIAEGVERDRAARQQAAADIQTNAQRAVQNLQRRIEQQDAAENAQLQRRIARIDLQLTATQKGTVQELELQQQKVQAQTALEIKQVRDTLAEKTRLRAVGYQQELAGLKGQLQQALEAQGLTEQQKTEITADYAQKRADVEAKYSLVAAQQAVKNIPLLRAEADATKLKLTADFLRQEYALELQSYAERTRASLASLKEGSTARLIAEEKLINQEEQLAIASLDRQAMSTLDYETKVTAIHADAAAKRRALDDQQTQQIIGNLQAEQQGAELSQQLMLAGLSESKQQEVKVTKQYANERLRAELDNYTAGLLATKANTVERENVEKQHLINLRLLDQEAEQNELARVKSKYEKISAIAQESISAIGVYQDAATQEQLNRIDREMAKATTSTARKAVLAKQEERISQQQHERQKQYAKAQAVIDLGSAIMRILADTPKADFGVMTAIQIALAGVTAAAQFRAIDSQKFAQGGIAYGPSHAQGGIQLTRGGRAVGIEIEGGEPVLTAAVSRNPVLLSMASMINQLAGGRALYRDPKPASEWLRLAEGGVVSSSASYLPALRTGGVVMAEAPAIDYEQLGSVLARHLGPAFVAGAQSLPPQQLNITELRAANNQIDKRQAETNI